MAEICVLPAGKKVACNLVDLSVRGCCITAEVAIPLKIHDRIELCFRVNGLAVRLAGTVRHLQGKERAGIEFTDVSRRKEAQVKELVNELFEREEELGLCASPEEVPGVLKRTPSQYD
jgi:c-di-GMP-binding flagellar brake protein YcgR